MIAKAEHRNKQMKKTVANSIHLIKKTLFLISVLAIFFPSSILAEDEFIFEDDPDLTGEGISGIANSALFKFNLPDNTNLLFLFIALIIAAVLGIIIYRAMLKSQITKGIHPREFFATITFTVLGFFLLTMFFVLGDSKEATSLGWFTIFAGLYLVFLISFMALGRLRKWILIVFILIISIIGFQLANMNIL